MSELSYNAYKLAGRPGQKRLETTHSYSRWPFPETTHICHVTHSREVKGQSRLQTSGPALGHVSRPDVCLHWEILEIQHVICAEPVCVKWAATHTQHALSNQFPLSRFTFSLGYQRRHVSHVAPRSSPSSNSKYCHSNGLLLVSLHAVHCCVCVSVSGGWKSCSIQHGALKVRNADRWAPLQTSCRPRLLQEVSATLRCNDPIWHSREEGYRWGVVWYLAEWSPSRLQQTPQRRV